MSIRTKLLFSTTLAVLLLASGCNTADRVDENADAGGPTIKEPSKVPGGNDGNTTDPSLTPITQTPITDNNDTTSEIKVDATNAYKLSMTLSSNKFQQFERGILTYELKELYSNELVNSSIINKITFSVSDTRYFKFVDFKGQESNTLTIDSENGVVNAENAIRVKMNDHSGTTEIKVTATIKLPDGEMYDLKNTIPVVVIKNKTASIAVNPYDTKWIQSGENEGLYVEKYIFHVVDKYGNKAKDGTSVKIGVVNEPKLYTLGYTNGTQLNRTGELKRDKTFTIVSDADTSFTKATIDNEDNLVILPNETKNDPTYLGAWSIDYVNDANTMTLVDDYTGNVDPKIPVGDVNGLTFVVGDEDRYNPCSKTLANAAFYFPDGAEVKDGIVYAELRYQPFMVGKTVFVSANAVIDGERIGISREMHLVGEGLDAQSVSCKNENEEDSGILIDCRVVVPMALTGYGNLARWVQPSFSSKDHSTFSGYTITNTECGGSSLVTFFNVLPSKSATAQIGEYIVWETIINK
jgi:hypothetical protein